MKKFFANIKSKLASMKNKAVISAKTALASTSGEGYIDTGVKIIIGVVIGGVILAGLYALFNTTIIPTYQEKLQNHFLNQKKKMGYNAAEELYKRVTGQMED